MLLIIHVINTIVQLRIVIELVLPIDLSKLRVCEFDHTFGRKQFVHKFSLFSDKGLIGQSGSERR